MGTRQWAAARLAEHRAEYRWASGSAGQQTHCFVHKSVGSAIAVVRTKEYLLIYEKHPSSFVQESHVELKLE